MIPIQPIQPIRPIQPFRRAVVAGLFALCLGGSTAFASTPGPVAAAGGSDWPGYLNGPTHTSALVGDPAITVANVGALTPVWVFHADPKPVPAAPDPAFDASPTVVGGRVFIGSRTGIFTALDAATGAVDWRKTLDWGSTADCSPNGIRSTAAVVRDPSSATTMLYAAGSHYLYALNPATGQQSWKTAIGPDSAAGEARWYNYSSPSVAADRIFMGMTSACDDLIRGGVQEVNQHTGKIVNTYYTVPKGKVGTSVWTSVATDGTWAWVSTGNPDPAAGQVYDAFSEVRLSVATGQKVEKFTLGTPITEDLDFGSSPTLFTATIGGVSTPMVGACNKNGIYYAWRRTNLAAGPVWQRRLAVSAGNQTGPCITSAAYDSATQKLWAASAQTTVNGATVPGAVRQLDPATGAVLWTQPLRCNALGSPTLNATTHVLAVPLYSCPTGVSPGVSLFNATTGAPLRTISTAGAVFAQPVFAEGMLFVADHTGTLTAYAP